MNIIQNNQIELRQKEMIATDTIIQQYLDTRMNTVASSILLNRDSLALADFAITKNFATVTYTGNGDTQDIVTGISSVDFTVSGNVSGFYNKRVGSGFAVIADNTVDLITSSDDTSSADNWTAGNDANISSDGVTLSVNADTTDYPKATEIISLDAGTYALSCNLGGTTPLFNISNDDGLDISISTSKLITFTIDDTVDCTISCTMNGTEDDDTATFSDLSILPIETSGECIVNTSKVHIKSRSEGTGNYTGSNVITDSLRNKSIYSNDKTTEVGSRVSSWNLNGITINASNNCNYDGDDFVLYQTLYTHIKWGTTNQGKKYIEAYNPVTRETMIMYEGSGNASHEIPHSLGCGLDYSDIKCLDLVDTGWLSNRYGTTSCMYLNTDIKEDTNYTTNIFSEKNIIVLETDRSAQNEAGSTYILYGKAKSENWTIVQYTGTGARNFVETKDVYGIARKPARVIIKAVSDTGSWLCLVRDGNSNNTEFKLDTADSVINVVASDNYENLTGFTLGTTGTISLYNASGVQYIALVEFDTNSNGGDSYFDLPTDDSNLNIDNGNFTYTNGVDGNGYLRSSEQVTQSIDFTGVSDGLKYIGKKLDGTGYIFEDRKPSVGLYKKQFADDNRLVFDAESGKHYTTTGGELVTNGGFDVDNDGWTSIVYSGSTYETSTDSLTWDSGRCKMVNPTDKDYATIEQELSDLTIGAEYVAQATFDTSDTAYFSVGEFSAIGNGTTSGEGFQSHNIATGVYTVKFIATASSMYINLQLSSNVDDAILYVDDISLYKLEPTIDQELSMPVSFLPNPVMVASETPMDIRKDDELPTNVIESLEVADSIRCNNYLGKNTCTAWVNFDGTTTPPTIRDSFNVTDVVKLETGKYEIYFEGEMDNKNYSAMGNCDAGSGVDYNYATQMHTIRTNKVGVSTIYNNDSQDEVGNNRPSVFIQIFGGKN